MKGLSRKSIEVGTPKASKFTAPVATFVGVPHAMLAEAPDPACLASTYANGGQPVEVVQAADVEVRRAAGLPGFHAWIAQQPGGEAIVVAQTALVGERGPAVGRKAVARHFLLEHLRAARRDQSGGVIPGFDHVGPDTRDGGLGLAEYLHARGRNILLRIGRVHVRAEG